MFYALHMQVQVVSSTNGGTTWGAPKLVATAGAPGDQFLPWLNVSKAGQVGVTWLDRRNDAANLKYEAFAAFSTDGGSTYPNVKLSEVQSDPNDDGFGGGFMNITTPATSPGSSRLPDSPASFNFSGGQSARRALTTGPGEIEPTRMPW